MSLLLLPGFLILACKGAEMPRFQAGTEAQERSTKSHFTELKYWRSILVMIFIYYALTCGLEGFFQVSFLLWIFLSVICFLFVA